jgi:hypothetical protein
MAGTFQKLRSFSAELMHAAKRRRQIAKLLKQKGLLPLGKGAWLGFRGKDVVSGILIEGGASDIYITSFLLPIFDERKFVTWSLGRRLINCSVTRSAEEECDDALNRYRNELLPVRSSDDLIRYLDDSGIDGFYPWWARYLCFLRNADLNQAEQCLDQDKIDELSSSALKNFEEISPSVADGDVEEVSRLLSKWEATSRLIFGYGYFDLNEILKNGRIK